MNRKIIIAIIFILVAVSGFLIYKKLNPKEVPPYLVAAVGRIDGDDILINTKYPARVSEIYVDTGDFVKKGELIAYTGNSGLSNGPHLHYEVRYIGVVLDPMNFIKWNLKNYNAIFKKERKVKWQSLIKAMKYQKQLIQQQLSQKVAK